MLVGRKDDVYVYIFFSCVIFHIHTSINTSNGGSGSWEVNSGSVYIIDEQTEAVACKHIHCLHLV